MDRVMIIGCCGAGKSTLAKKLGKVVELEVIHLDQHYWQPNWVETPKEEWESVVRKLASKPSWIIDGNYGGTMDMRFLKADTIIYLDYSTVRCLWRITKRIMKYHGKRRPDMPEGCNERFDMEFYHYVATYNMMRRKKTIQRLHELKDEKNIVVLRGDREVSRFLLKLRSENDALNSLKQEI